MRPTLAAAVGTALLLAGCSSAARTVPPNSPAAASSPASPASLVSPASSTSATHSAVAVRTGQPSASSTSSPAVPKPVTGAVVLRPVTATGRPAAGYTVVAGSNGPVSCGLPGNASPVAVDGGIVSCSPAAAVAVACWRSDAARQVLCYQDPWSRRVVRLATDDTFTEPAAVRMPTPLGLLLGDGTRCWLRTGGAWDRLDGHPELSGTYGCQGEQAVWATANSDGVNRTAALWTVRVAPMNGHGALRTVSVRTAYYVGTAAR